MKTLEKLAAGVLTLCMCGFLVTSALAFDEKGRFRGFGPANEPCSEFNALRDRQLAGHSMEEQDAIEIAVQYWISGFATAWNYFKKDTYDMTGGYKFDDLVEQVEKFCERNPDKKLVTAVLIVGHAMHPWRLTKEPKGKQN